MNAFSGFYCYEQLLLSKYISEEAIKRKLFDYKVFFILKISFSVHFDLQNLLTRETEMEIKMILCYWGSLFSVYWHERKRRWSNEVFRCRAGASQCLQGCSVLILFGAWIVFCLERPVKMED